MQFFRNHSSKFLSYFSSSKSNILNLQIILLVFLTTLLVTIGLLLKTVFYDSPIYLSLPSNSTLAAVEWTSSSSSEAFKSLARKMGLANAARFIELEKEFYAQFRPASIENSLIQRKLLTWQIVDSKIEQVLVLEFKDKETISSYFSISGLSQFKKQNLLYLSTSAKALENIKNPTSKQLSNNSTVQDAFSNLPKQNILDFYLNHQLLDDSMISGYFSLAENLNTTLAVTVASLRENNLGLVLSTYTTPAQGLQFPYTLKKYQAKLALEIPADQNLFLGGVNATPRILGFIKNLPNFSSETAVENEIFSLLNTYNLTTDSLKVLTRIFSSEYGFTFDKDNQTTFYFEPETETINTQIATELNNLASYFNPEIISYLLQDGQVGKQLVPTENFIPQVLSPTLTAYTLEELQRTFFWNRSQLGQFSFISTALNPQYTLSLKDQKLSQNKFFSAASQLLLPIADEILYVNKNYLNQFTVNQLDLQDTPNIFTATNFFTDGLQTVTIFQW